MSDTPYRDKRIANPEGLRTWHQERSIFETTEMICGLMEDRRVTRSELASRLGKSKGYITKLLDGSVNMTLRTISDVFTVLGYEFHPSQSPINTGANLTSWSFFELDLSSVPTAAESTTPKLFAQGAIQTVGMPAATP